jgi:hypothetical protein
LVVPRAAVTTTVNKIKNTQINFIMGNVIFPPLPLFWMRVLLLPSCGRNATTVGPGIFRGLAALITLIVIAVDAGVYDHGFHPREGDKAPWVVYGTNLAMLACLFYFLGSLVLIGAPKFAFLIPTQLDPEPALARLIWALHSIALSTMTLSLVLYTLVLKNTNTYRQSQEASYIIVFILMFINALLTAVRFHIQHVVIVVFCVLSYVVFVYIFSALFDVVIYPPFASLTNAATVIVLSAVVSLFIHFAFELKKSFLTRFDWELPVDQVDDGAMDPV